MRPAYKHISSLWGLLFELRLLVTSNELAETMEMGRLLSVVEDIFFKRQVHSVAGLVPVPFISGCWEGIYGSMGEVYEDITTCCNDCSL